jgi:hypothetical protein
VLLAAVRPTQWQLQHAFHGIAALLQVADGISGLNDINVDIDIDIEASQVEASPFQRVTLLCIQWEKREARTRDAVSDRVGRHLVTPSECFAPLSPNRP